MLSLRPGARGLRCHCVLLTLCLALCSSLALAQNGGTIRGEVRDPDARVMPNVQVELRNSATGTTIRTRTSAAGRYSFESFPPAPTTCWCPQMALPSHRSRERACASNQGRLLPSTSDCNGEVTSAPPVMIIQTVSAFRAS